MMNKINEAHKLLCEVAKELAENQDKDYKGYFYQGLTYQTLCEIDNVAMDIRVLAGVSKSKYPKEERVKKYVK